jgi:hypothetical protein
MLAIRKINTLGLAGLMVAVAMLTIGVFAAASASALEWQERKCEKVTEGGFINSACTEEGLGEFEWGAWKAISSPLATTSEGTLILEDTKAAFGPSRIECEGSDEGTVGPGTADELTKATATKCKVLSGACSEGSAVAHAVHLPWKTKLEVINGEVRDKIESSGAGEPGWNVECTAIFKVEDTCTGTTTTGIKNVSTGVDAIFDAKSAHANCTQGGAGSGVVEGTDHILNPTGKQIRVLSP